MKKCWTEKEEGNGKDLYGKERVSFYNRNTWVLEDIKIRELNLEAEIIKRKRDLQRQWEESRIANAKYNKKYNKK